MTTAASLPLTRPSSDTYGPELVNDKPVTRRDRELDAGAWNKVRADLAACGLMVALLRARITNNGAAAVADSSPLAPTVAWIATGHTQVTMPAGVTPRFAMFSCPVASTVNTFSYTITGNVIDVWTYVSSGGPIALTDLDYVIEVS